ncbi:hypothetical protein IW492_00155 [Enterococcus sp. BWB1-3]|uniref:hypothetical protein n=1 Tax=Enterococcus sp. BWB1-3 TaxID=2787713 RepID=UPI001920EA4E|nr:hypothetical protein [Enterococcus sp. BWB1-3]MBL1227642.1 hypothetical protein [Enterococcus sp. BWB1-3]
MPFLDSGDKTKTHTPGGSLSRATVTEQTDVSQLFIETVKKLLPFQSMIQQAYVTLKHCICGSR